MVAQLGEHDAPREGAVLMERLLAVETPERAPELAGRLATMWEAAGDLKGVQRTLELAHRSAPDDTAIHDRLFLAALAFARASRRRQGCG